MQPALRPYWTSRVPCRLCRSALVQRSRLHDVSIQEASPQPRRLNQRYFTAAPRVRQSLAADKPPPDPDQGPNHHEQQSRPFATAPNAFANPEPARGKDQHVVVSHKSAFHDDAVARRARQTFGDVLPEAHLTAEQLKSYVRLYGEPEIRTVGDEAAGELQAEEENVDGIELESGTGVLVEGPDGALEEVEFEDEELVQEEELDEEPGSFEDMLNSPEFIRLRKSKRGKFFARAKKQELDDAVLFAEMNQADMASLSYLDKEWKGMDQDEQAVYLEDVRYMKLEQYLRDQERDDEADELLQCLFIFIESQAKPQETVVDGSEATEQIPEGEVLEEESMEEDQSHEDQFQRTHPFTLTNRFATFPSTVQLPKGSFTGPVSAIISGSSPTHLKDAAQRTFGGPGLPYSTSNPHFARLMPQKHIPLDVTQDKMSEIDADAYFAAIMPGTYAGLMSVLVETRKRLGSEWLKTLMNKDGGPRILDAGSGGAGVIAFRELLRAEWERLNDNSEDLDASKELATPDGREGGAPAEAPAGRATVLVASTALRQRASVLLDNTTFVPRLPDYVHASDPQAAQHGKFDVILAPHSLWSLKEDFLRKQHLANLWSLLNADGGVLILLEKGVPRGFETIAGARKFLLDSRIASPGSQQANEDVTEPGGGNLQGIREKEKGMIIGPCTNHAPCPMFTRPGISPGRKDYCHFEQRYVRPSYLQKLVNARDKNHEDVKFSYLSVMRGHDLRQDVDEPIIQGDLATERAFEGYEHAKTKPSSKDFDPTAPAVEDIDFSASSPSYAGPHGLTLPRMIMPPLKRTGHIILDLCTPSGTLERWTVTKSFSKQAFRDARKSAWGDLWALGAKTRIPRNLKLGTREAGTAKSAQGHSIDLKKVQLKPKAKKILAEQPPSMRKRKDVYDVPVDPLTGRASEDDVRKVGGGRMRFGKVTGVRDKRNKAGRERVRRREED
ncbi:hypothetical protein ANO11243_051230 [Dothideomycetidae sp. 11243]|nr:hypothetical protein ANO11243_051230 [fungal sp. No.11243]